MALGRNVLLFHAGALGDFVLTWPIAVALARLHPQSRIFCVTHGSKGKLAEKAIGVDAADIDVGWHPLHGNAVGLSAAHQKLLQGAHTIVSFVSDGRDAWAANVAKLSPKAHVLYLQTPPRGVIPGQAHVSDFFLRQLEDYSALHTAVQQILRSIAARGIGGLAKANTQILIHPGGGSTAKCWPIERFIEVAKRLVAMGWQVGFILGEAESERLGAAQVEQLAAVVATVHRPANFVELYELLRATEKFIGNDSGPAHLAAIVGVPTVVIFGSEEPHCWKPLGPAVKVVDGDGLEAVGVQQVMTAVTG